ncbi:protein-tyrosine phosphatase family protein [Haloferula sp.]|uniref:protein-tyrosine phosphatase family protein n=1 Tax=Haloferula sp. TaxID=2497595 RepID=UPI003C73F420
MSPEKVQMYEAVKGVVFAGEYPGFWKPKLALKRLNFVVGQGVTTFVNLTTKHDQLEPYEGLLAGIDPGLKHLPFPIPDMDVPSSDEVMSQVLAAIRREGEAGRVCYVHCWGGIGRTGTVIGCLFREQGLGADEALEKVQSLYAKGMPKVARNPHSPQTRKQCDYVRDWGG